MHALSRLLPVLMVELQSRMTRGSSKISRSGRPTADEVVTPNPVSARAADTWRRGCDGSRTGDRPRRLTRSRRLGVQFLQLLWRRRSRQSCDQGREDVLDPRESGFNIRVVTDRG